MHTETTPSAPAMSRSSSVVVARLGLLARDDEFDAAVETDERLDPTVTVAAAPGVHEMVRDGGTSRRAEMKPLELGQPTAPLRAGASTTHLEIRASHRVEQCNRTVSPAPEGMLAGSSATAPRWHSRTGRGGSRG